MRSDFEDATVKITSQTKGAPVRGSGVVISVVDGPDRGSTFQIEDAAHRRVLVGQSEACHVRLTDRSISRRHVSVEIEGSRLRLLDLGSRNGTFVGTCEVKEVFLRSGAEVALGKTVLRLELDGASHGIEASSESRFGRVLGASPEMRRLYPLFDRLVGKDTHVLLEGEAGTGKELVAETIHDGAGNPDAPFVVFEPSSFPPERLDAELFGGDGAPGALEQAAGGSLFVDEVADLPITLQTKLLRVLERREHRRADGQVVPLRVRVFASTRRDLDAEVQNRRFREELLLALSTPRIELPALRRRTGDVVFLTQCFWVALGGKMDELGPSTVQRFSEHAWPGNVRELYYAVGRAVASGQDAPPRAVASAKHGPGGAGDDLVTSVLARDLPLPVAREEVIAAFERRYVERMLERHGGHVGRAATASGIGRRYFQKLRAKR